MFNVGNQIIVKATGQEGYIYSILDEDKYVIHTQNDNMLKVKFVYESDIELKPCEFGKDGYCNYTCGGPRGRFACMYCELARSGEEL